MSATFAAGSAAGHRQWKQPAVDDTPFPAQNNQAIVDENGKLGNLYPYHEAAPIPPDRDYETDQRTLRTAPQVATITS